MRFSLIAVLMLLPLGIGAVESRSAQGPPFEEPLAKFAPVVQSHSLNPNEFTVGLGVGGLGGGGLGGGGLGGDGRPKPASDWLTRTLERTLRKGRLDTNAPDGLDGYECDLAHVEGLEKAARAGIQLRHPWKPGMAGAAPKVEGRIGEAFLALREAPAERLEYYSGLRSTIFVVRGWRGELRGVEAVLEGEIVRVDVKPVFGHRCFLATFDYVESYLLDRDGRLTYLKTEATDRYRGKGMVAGF